MRGSPLLRAVIALVVLLGFAPVIWHVTRAGAGTSGPARPAVTEAGPKRVRLALSFTMPARRVAILHLGREVWAKSGPAGEEAAALELPWPKEGVELAVKVEWPEGTPMAAMRMLLVTADGAEYDRSVWGRGSAEDVLVFK